jgi:hypothetical protein
MAMTHREAVLAGTRRDDGGVVCDWSVRHHFVHTV